MILKWDKRLRDEFGWYGAKDLYIKEEKCLKQKCFQPHDWYHDNHLVCLTNAKNGCPDNCEDL